MRKGLIWFSAVAALAVMLPPPASASTSRMTGLNAPGDYVKGEYTGMFTYMSAVNSVGNLAYVDPGSSWDGNGDHAMGVVLPGLFDGKYGVWSLSLRQVHPALGQPWNYSPIVPEGEDPNYAGEAFDIIWGHKLGSGSLALRINRSFVSYDDGTTTTEGDGDGGRNILGFGGGYGWDMNANTQVEVGALYQQRSYDRGPGYDTDNGGNAMLVAARAFRKCAGNMTLIPAVKFYSFDQSYTDQQPTPVDYEHKTNGWQAGLAGNWTVGSDDLLVLGAQFAQVKETEGDEEYTDTFMPNVFLALETHINPWLSFRAGAQNTMFHSDKYKSPTLETTDNHSEFTFNMGTTVKLGSLTFDAVLDPAFLQNPIAQLMGGSRAGYYYGGYDRTTGGSYGGVAFPQVSATYTW